MQNLSIPWAPANEHSTVYVESVHPVEVGEEKFRDIRKTVYIMEIREDSLHDISEIFHIMEIKGNVSMIYEVMHISWK